MTDDQLKALLAAIKEQSKQLVRLTYAVEKIAAKADPKFKALESEG